jgi:acylpyruvate hydrolase
MKIICIGRNYAAHAAELGNERPDRPVVFMKPPTAILPNNKPFYHPEFS